MKKMLEKYGFKKKNGIYYRIHNKEVFQVIGVVKISGLWFLKYTFLFLHIDDFYEMYEEIDKGIIEFDAYGLISQDIKYFFKKDDAMSQLNEKILKQLDDLSSVNNYVEFCDRKLIFADGTIMAPILDEYLYIKNYESAEEIILNEIDRNKFGLLDFTIFPFAKNEEKNYICCELCEREIEVQQKLLEKVRNKCDFSSKYNEIYNKNVKFLIEKFGDYAREMLGV